MLSSLILILSTLACAEQSSPQMNEAYQAGLDFAKSMSNKAENDPSRPCCQAELLYKKSVSNQNQDPIPADQSDKILIFVSFSMPESSLKALADNIKLSGHKATLILRGLVDNSFKKTASKIREMEAEVEINPGSFEDYKITKVPTFVLLQDGKEATRLSVHIHPFCNQRNLVDITFFHPLNYSSIRVTQSTRFYGLNCWKQPLQRINFF